MRTLGIVTARGGSKAIPRKNIVDLLGKPLLAYTAEAALAAQRLDRVVLSTDSEEIARVGEKWGLQVPFMRPDELARDETPTVPVLQHVVRELEQAGDSFDAVFALQPTAPLRRPSDIDGAVELLEASQADSVISFVDVGEKHPYRMKLIDAAGRVSNPSFCTGGRDTLRRQDLPPFYLREGSVYVVRRDVLMKHGSVQGEDCRAWLIPAERTCNIDTPFDLLLAELLLKGGPGSSSGSSRLIA